MITSPASSLSLGAECRHDPHLLEGLWPCRPSHWLDLWSGGYSGCVEPRAWPLQSQCASDSAGAAAIRDQAFIGKAVEHNTLWLDKLTHAFESFGLKVTPSVTNFLLIHFPDVDGKRAPEADEFLTSRGYILRAVKGYGFPNALRMTVGSEEANRGVIEALGEFMSKA